MTMEDKQLLLKDLCARLPYGVFVHYHWSREGKTIDEDRELDFSDVETLKYNIENPQNDWCEISWKPYLRPILSMTKEEEDEYRKCCFDDIADSGVILVPAHRIDFLNANHIDYLGLIEKGLAIEVTEENNPYNHE